jgi:hypothetical protein
MVLVGIAFDGNIGLTGSDDGKECRKQDNTKSEESFHVDYV